MGCSRVFPLETLSSFWETSMLMWVMTVILGGVRLGRMACLICGVFCYCENHCWSITDNMFEHKVIYKCTRTL